MRSSSMRWIVGGVGAQFNSDEFWRASPPPASSTLVATVLPFRKTTARCKGPAARLVSVGRFRARTPSDRPAGFHQPPHRSAEGAAGSACPVSSTYLRCDSTSRGFTLLEGFLVTSRRATRRDALRTGDAHISRSETCESSFSAPALLCCYSYPQDRYTSCGRPGSARAASMVLCNGA